jgi:hypothetical protein
MRTTRCVLNVVPFFACRVRIFAESLANSVRPLGWQHRRQPPDQEEAATSLSRLVGLMKET